MTFEPASLNFDAVPLGATRRLTVRITNQGNAGLELISVDTMAPFGAGSFEKTVPAGESVDVDVFFRPANDETQSGMLLIGSNDPVRPVVEVALRGSGAQGVLTARPSRIELQQIKSGTTRLREIEIENLGLAPVEGRVVTEGFDRPEHYTLSLLPVFAEPAPFGLAARTQQVLELTYRPLVAGRDDGIIRLEICGQRCGIEVEVVANASETEVVLEPLALAFGGVPIGQRQTESLAVRNVGDESVNVVAVEVVGGPELAVASTRPLPVALGSGDPLGINVEYTPASAAEIEGRVIVTLGPVEERLEASVSGHGEGPLFAVSPQEVRFGVEREPGRYVRALLLSNGGSADVRVETIALEGAPELSLDGLVGLPLILGVGESVVVNVVFEPVSIGEYHATVRVVSDDPATPSVSVPVAAGLSDAVCELEVNPGRVNFGLLPVGFERAQSVRVSNGGGDVCTLVDGAFRAPVDAALSHSGPSYPFVLNPGQGFDLGFRYAPTANAETKGNFVFTTDDPVFPERTVTVIGTANGYDDVFAQPEYLEFGAMVPRCSRRERSFRLFNAGTTNLRVGSVALTSTMGEYIVVNSPPAGSVLRAGNILDLAVSYQAQDVGRDSSEVEIQFPSLPFPLVVPLSGEGSLDSRQSDFFEQESNNLVDVLFVVDNSCSMEDDQQALAQNFRSFIQQADLRQVDFRIGITTTDVFEENGDLVGPVMSRSTRALETQFAGQANVGVDGSGFEQGLEAMRQAIRKADSGFIFNRDLLRPGAVFVGIIVSDEDDQSFDTVVGYFNGLRRRFTGGLVTAVVTEPPQGGCGFGAPAPRYEQFAALSEGLTESLCSDWASTLSNIGQAAFGLETRFVLSTLPDVAGAMRVFVDGVEVPSSAWSFNSTDNAVDFVTPPPEGAEVRIEYRPGC